MPISAQQWRVSVGRANASRSLRPHVTGQPKMKLTSWDVLLFILTVLLGTILLSADGGRGTGERKCVSRGSGGGGTVGELPPSLLTAPQRKELLMLAGDVESNPGPYTEYGELRLSDLELVVEELRGVKEKWRVIGRALPSGSVDNITYPDPTDCLREVFKRWLQCIGTTWGHIIVALRTTGELQLADNLKAKYIPDLLEESDLDLLTQELSGVKQKWYEIGVDLDIPKMNEIRHQYSDPDVCLRETLRAELQHPTPTTWRNIVDALRSPGVGESQLADQLEAKYCPNLPSVSLFTQELTAVSEKWQYIGEELGVEQSSLRDIRTRHSDPGDCLREMLKQQFQSCDTTWKHIVAALRTPRIGESHLADHLEVKYCPTAQQILQKALEKGYVDCHIWKVLVTGAAGSGKTTLKHRLFGKEPPSIRCSTALAEAAIRAISREIVGTDLTGWFKVTSDELMELLGGALKAGVPMEETKFIPWTSETGHKQPAQFSIPDHSRPSTVAHSTVGTSSMPTSEAAVNVQTKISTGDSKQPKRDDVSVSSSPLPPTVASSPVTTTSELTPITVSSAKKELVQLVEKSQGSKRFLELQWIHFIDSGGQPQFHEILPAFIRNTTATIFVMKLSERLDEHPMIEYYDVNGEISGKPYRHALSNDQMLQCCVRTILSQPSREGKHSKTLVVGTHRDRESSCSESRAEKNVKLIDMLTPLKNHLVYYRLGSEVIFPINAKKPKELDHQVCVNIRKQIEDRKNAPPPYKIPIGWFLLEQDIIKASKGGVISKTACLGIAASLSINAEALTAALQYFDNLNIFLYYPSILPEVVFSDPQVLLDKLTELVHFSYSLQSDNPSAAGEGARHQSRDKGRTTRFWDKLKSRKFQSSHPSGSPPVALEGMWLQFRDKGIVTLEMFQHERFSAHYNSTVFTPPDLIKLLKHLLIIAPLSSTEYFMPSLLQMSLPEEVMKQLPSTAAPLLVHFPAGCAQNGIFCALVVYLLSECQWKFAKGALECVSRSCVCFQLPGKPVCIAVVDSFSYFKICVKALDTMYPKVCPMIRKAIFCGLKAAYEALRYNNSTPVPAFFCKCSTPPHAAIPTVDDENQYLMCTESTNSGPLTKKHTVWLDIVKLTTTCFGEGNVGDTFTSSTKRQGLNYPLLPVVKGVRNSTVQATFHSVIQDAQVPNDQQRFPKNLHATAGQPHFTPLKPPYHHQPHQYTQPCGSNGKSGVSLVHHLSLQQQEVAPQEPPYHLPQHQHTPPWGQFEQQQLFPQLLHPSSQGIGMTGPQSKQQQCYPQMLYPQSQGPKPTQKQLLQQLYNTVPDKWQPIGIYLEIPEGQLNAIDAKHHGDPQKCLMAMLTESWLARVSPPPTWQDLAEAVEFVGYPDVAQKLRDKFCSQQVNPHTPT